MAVPVAGSVLSTFLSMLTVVVLALCLTDRLRNIEHWSKMPLMRWLVFAIYIDSILFIITTSVLEHGFGLDSEGVCSAAILVCLVCYMSTKVLIYYFLVEKVYLVRSVRTPRLKSKLYLLNCFGMLAPYCVLVILNFVYRISYIRHGTCVIGMQTKVMLPLIIFDAVVNCNLTLLFVIPLRKLYSYQNQNAGLKSVALRSFLGSLCTLTSSIVNLSVLMVLKGEHAWICLMCCNADILFCVLMIHWVTRDPRPPSLSGTDKGRRNESGAAVTTQITARSNVLGNNIDDVNLAAVEMGGITVQHVVQVQTKPLDRSSEGSSERSVVYEGMVVSNQ
ncbi:hypothetical protein ASPZODRAFT_24703 [Penicilliopsis zonata CBS 506.65]|uniref:G-protein coupled receptors family 1 profile domain-containing protein n=1 Tax=Penicilliopsis zonata CBS 506.65 TaxID=1073090 RepID=A0A1L9SL17_9EURO|nr:hypothetical protein ASPZODRAFT_24703 [Penicilliopsis zonata CBS 506.65]OJJ47811.1 hypothetical protein ASPZODRAFT_24703 [Penicilliopsis zonata CBS 506.65]